MQRKNFAVPVKLWASGCTIVGISMTSNTVLTCILALTGFLYLSVQHNWRALKSFGVFYIAMAVLLYLIRYQGLHMVVFSEFYVLMFWNLFAVFIVGWDLITTPPGELSAFMSRIHMPTAGVLGLLVMFRFFPTMKAELKKQYDGYHFSNALLDVYNPFSIINAFNKMDIDNYWYKSGTPTYLVKLLEGHHVNMQKLTSRPYESQ